MIRVNKQAETDQADFVLSSKFKRKNVDRIYRMNMIFQKKRDNTLLIP